MISQNIWGKLKPSLPILIIISTVLVGWTNTKSAHPNAAFYEEAAVPFPEDYKDMHVVKEAINNEGNILSGIIPDGPYETRLNDTAYQHFKSNYANHRQEEEIAPFPEGSIILLTLYKDQSKQQAALMLVMHKDETYEQEGGWGWQGFLMPDKEGIVKDHLTECANCHYKGTKDMDGAFFLNVDAP
ncbi:MAG: cytochrome P460 family protein [Bacteroidota bacterium]